MNQNKNIFKKSITFLSTLFFSFNIYASDISKQMAFREKHNLKEVQLELAVSDEELYSTKKKEQSKNEIVIDSPTLQELNSLTENEKQDYFCQASTEPLDFDFQFKIIPLEYPSIPNTKTITYAMEEHLGPLRPK
jgi:hypothetical protein